MRTSPITILLIDDDDLDRRSIKRAFKQEKIANPIVEAKDGREALSLMRRGDKAQLEKPYLVLLDLNMPIMDGHEFLDEVRADDAIKDTIIFVLTTSSDDEDKVRAYEKHIAGYLLKKNIGDEFMNKIKMLDLFMLSVEFPEE